MKYYNKKLFNLASELVTLIVYSKYDEATKVTKEILKVLKTYERSC
jgi:hypothetical protein